MNSSDFYHNLINSDHTWVMGILNATPDSFSDGGEANSLNSAIKKAEEMIHKGAHIIDIGAESTRPGAESVSEQEEIQRLSKILPELIRLRDKHKIYISLDTYKASVAEYGLELGVDIINDISAGDDPRMFETVSKYQSTVVLMHKQGSPKDMQNEPQYNNPVEDIKTYLKAKAEEAEKTGIDKIVVDPGIGFGKTLEHNLEIINRLEELAEIGKPLLFASSRKSHIVKIIPELINPKNRVIPTIAENTLAVYKGARIIRVHDVAEHVHAMKVIDAIKK